MNYKDERQQVLSREAVTEEIFQLRSPLLKKEVTK
jgi:hypothetical protein